MKDDESSASRFAPIATGLAAIAIVFALVEAMIRAGWINRFIVPLPSAVLASFERVIAEENVLYRTLFTGAEALAAGVMVAIAGGALGVLLTRRRVLRLATESWVAALAAAPLVLMYPLFLVMFGRNALTIIMIGFAAGLPPVILKTVEGLSGTRQTLIDVGRSFKLTSAQEFWKIRFPAALPTIFVGWRLGIMFALINIVGVEFLINFGGLGQLVNELAERYDLPAMYAAIVFVVLVSVAFFLVTERIERWLATR
jgi:ABC-type nitrate/sulfonate/bicarbonate transport system permease component